jgi:hydrogenase nickel incorporation protein HypA/HybF
MHELSLANALLESLLRVAAEQRATRIVELEVDCGVLQQVVPEALATAFEALSQGTPAAGARLRIREVGLRVRCRKCGAEYAAAIDNYVCAGCGAADVELLAGRDMVLRSVVCDVAEGTAPGRSETPESEVRRY